jgi:site-specific DNA-cytosine methylase
LHLQSIQRPLLHHHQAIPTKVAGPLPLLCAKGKKGKTLDLFSGTQSVAQRLRFLGYEVITLDLDGRTDSTITADLLSWDYTVYPPGYFCVIAASVPCAEYSIAKTTAPREFVRADALVCRVLDIVEYFRPKLWWIENPRSGFLKDRPMLQNVPFVDIDYCQFSDWGYCKPTRFWGGPDLGGLPHVKCPGKNCPNMLRGANGVSGHREKLGGNQMHFNTVQKGRIPPRVIDYLLQEGEFSSGYSKITRNMQGRGYKFDPALRRNIIEKWGLSRDKG